MTIRFQAFALSCFATFMLTACNSANTVAQAPTPEASETTAQMAPLIPGAHWHHVHLNSTDPDASAAFYAKHFKADIASFSGADAAVKAQNVWLLFTKVDDPAPTEFVTPIWHVGWGAPDPQSTYKRQQALGAKFAQPITDISTVIERISPQSFYYMYVESPDGAWTELNTAASDDFGHIHLYSEDPVAAGEFYARFFGISGRNGAPPSRSVQPSFSKSGIQNGPSASLYFDQVNMIIYPVEHSKGNFPDDWSDVSELQSSRGYVNDHIGLSVPDLEAALQVFRQAGTPILAPIAELPDGTRYAFIEGPDKLAIELLEIAQ